jgi:putative transposase
VAEWLKAHAWKACLGLNLTRVRIPLCPPSSPPHRHLVSPYPPLRELSPLCPATAALWQMLHTRPFTENPKIDTTSPVSLPRQICGRSAPDFPVSVAGQTSCHETVRYWWNKFGALKVLKNLMSRYGKPKETATDKLPSYKAALKDPSAAYLQNTGQHKNNQVENLHLHFRQQERCMNQFRSIGTLQKFIAVQSAFFNHFNHQRHLEKRQNFKELRQNSIEEWHHICAG